MRSSDEPVIQVNGISKRFMIGMRERLTVFSSIRHALSGEYPRREHWALRDVSFTVKRGEMVAVIGHNGAGKTTLLRIIAGIMAQTGGSLRVNGRISTIFELGLGFNPRFTALENVYLYGALHGIQRREIDRILPDIISFSEVGEFLGARISEFSSGMRARLAFATVIHTVRDVVLIDEVLSVGDEAFQVKCIDAMRGILNTGATIIFISHGLGLARELCTSGLCLEHGRLVAAGPLEEVEARYHLSSGAHPMPVPDRTQGAGDPGVSP